MENSRRCRFSADSVSPSPPPALSDPFSDYFIEPPSPVKATRVDYFSALPQELIEEIGLLTCAPPYTSSVPSEPFLAERHRIRTLHALCLTSRQFNQIFNPLLYLEPLVIDTQFARSPLPNSATMWLYPSSYDKAPLAKRFTLWRPRSEDPSNHLSPVNPFIMLFMLTNIRELTLSGNFRNSTVNGNGSQECLARNTPWVDTTLQSKYVPHLTSIRLLDIDDAQSINTLLFGIAPQITSLEIQPSSTGISEDYSPRSVYSTLRPMIETLTILESLTVSLPALSVGINHCNHAHKLVQKTLCALPNKEKLKSCSISLPSFDCRSMQWIDGSDSEDEDNQDPGRTVDHAWFWMTLQNFLQQCTNLDTFNFKGSQIPHEIGRRLRACCLSARMSFIKAEHKTVRLTTTSPTAYHPPPPRIATVPPPNLLPPPQIYPFQRPIQETSIGPAFPLQPISTIFGPMAQPYLEPLPQPESLARLPPGMNLYPEPSIFDFNYTAASSTTLPPMYGNFQPDWQLQPEQTWGNEGNERQEVNNSVDNQELTYDQESSSFYVQDTMNFDVEGEDWEWLMQYDHY
jgi:hypothetical protein